MLVRAYRFTDKLGIATLKSTTAVVDATLAGAGVLVNAGGRGGAGILGLLLLVVLGIGRTLRWVALAIWVVVRLVLRLFGRLAFFLGRRTAYAAEAAGGSASGAMARRAARAEMEAGLAEDPLRTQNRVLSRLTVLLLALLIGVVLWASNPARNADTGLPGGSQNFGAALGSTPNATTLPQLSTPVPTATTLPSVLQVQGTIAYVARENGQDDIWAVSVGTRTSIRLVASPADDRDPAWDPTGRRLAYASRQDGNWELYIYDLVSGTKTPTRMTYNPSFQGAPQWSPDGKNLVYESYEGNNLDVYIVPIDGSQQPLPVTSNPAPDFAPSWSPDGRRIAFVSWRDGNQDIYVFSLDNPVDAAAINLTNTPTRQEDHPRWSPDGKYILYSAIDEGVEKVFVKAVDDPRAEAQVLERGRTPAWSPNGSSLVFAVDSLEGTQFVAGAFGQAGTSTMVIGVPLLASGPTWTGTPLPIALVNAGGVGPGVAKAPYIEQVTSPDQDGLYRLMPMPSVKVARSSPFLNVLVDDSFNALRQRVLDGAGWDFLGELDDAWWDINRKPQPGEEKRNWYMTGRAFGISRNLIAGFPSQIELVREDLGVNTYWRLYVRVTDESQFGLLGEPLRQMPWDMLSRRSGDVQAYDQGGRLKAEVPSGYYVDFTQLAEDYGWGRVPAGYDWRDNTNSINYWLFEKADGLDWLAAMRQLYTEAQLGGFAPTATPGSGQP